ncbi:MAG TPA: methylglyoxal synthase [Rheinheimera sp.]|nr:methylglyoxal synthase [Rheinheimera sp.]
MKSIALVAHDGKKAELLAWVETHAEFFQGKQLYATGTTGKLISERLQLPVTCLASGPLGGDQQIGALITEQQIDWLVFFWDPLASQPHDPDVKALIRLAVVWNIPVACNKATADFIVHSSLFQTDYQRQVPDFQQYLNRQTPVKG